MKKVLFSIVALSIFASGAACAKTFKVATLNCSGQWIREGTEKITLLDSCGTPVYSETVSGAVGSKVEKLYFKVGGKTYVITTVASTVKRIEQTL